MVSKRKTERGNNWTKKCIRNTNSASKWKLLLLFNWLYFVFINVFNYHLKTTKKEKTRAGKRLILGFGPQGPWAYWACKLPGAIACLRRQPFPIFKKTPAGFMLSRYSLQFEAISYLEQKTRFPLLQMPWSIGQFPVRTESPARFRPAWAWRIFSLAELKHFQQQVQWLALRSAFSRKKTWPV